MSEIVTILIEQIDAGGRLRPASEPHVEALMASIARAAEAGVGHEGLREPIEVRPLPGDDEGVGYALVAGLHRLEACRRLGRDAIAAVEYDIGKLEAELLEVEENLVRADLNALDRAFFVKRFREMFEGAYGAVTRGGAQEFVFCSGQRGNVPLWSDAAMERLGISEDIAKRALRIANNLTPESVARLRGTGWDENQKALLALAGVTPPERQAEVLDALLDGDGCATMQEAIDQAFGKKRQIDDEARWLKKSAAIFQAPKTLRRKFWASAVHKHRREIREAFAAAGLGDPEGGA